MASRNSFKSGSCEMLVLHILKNYGDCYAYQISQFISDATQGQLSFPEGSLYPAFYKMIDNGYISDYKKQVGKRLIRVYYHLEAAGEERLAHLLDEYHSTINSINTVLSYDFKSMEDKDSNE